MHFDLTRTKLDRSRPMRDQIYPILRELILTCGIGPGEVIDEKAIAAQLHISRTPVREAVKKLSDENLVDVVAQSGTRAALINLAEIEQAYLTRRALEMECAARAAARFDATQLEALQAIVAQHAKAFEQRKFVKAVALDDSFHRHIAQVAELPRLWRTVEISKAHLDRCRHMLVPQAGEGAITLQQHHAIVQALATGDGAQAREAMRQHLDDSYQRVANLLRTTLVAA